MSHIYVASFSSGHIKVGRSIDPQSRIAQHEERIACLGFTLTSWSAFVCIDNASRSEAALIEWCTERADRRYKSEWFVGLTFDEVADAARRCASMQFERIEAGSVQGIVHWLMYTGGLTQKAIADRAGFAQASISAIANGKIGHTRPSYELVTKLQALHAVVLEEQAKAKGAEPAEASATA